MAGELSACGPQTVYEPPVCRVFITCSSVHEHRSFRFVEFGVFGWTRFVGLSACHGLYTVLARTVRILGVWYWRLSRYLRTVIHQGVADRPPSSRIVCQGPSRFG
jgi:hypothetical protein